MKLIIKLFLISILILQVFSLLRNSASNTSNTSNKSNTSNTSNKSVTSNTSNTSNKSATSNTNLFKAKNSNSNLKKASTFKSKKKGDGDASDSAKPTDTPDTTPSDTALDTTPTDTPPQEQTSLNDNSKNWEKLFGHKDRPVGKCPPKKLKKEVEEEKEEVYVDTNFPKPKPNHWLHNHGFGSVSYFFDYIDEILREKIVGEFKKIWSDAKEIKVKDEEDPYDLKSQLFYLSQQKYGKPGSNDSQEQIMAQFKEIKPSFNEALWKEGLSLPVVREAVLLFGWKRPEYHNWDKLLFDAFDFDGDGRHNVKEFLLMSIEINKRTYLDGKYYQDIIRNYLLPMFAYSDCEGEGLIDSDNIFEAFKDLQRKNVNEFNIYQCQVPFLLNSGYRVTATNDLVLKNSRVMGGKLNKEEFIAGILLGYWDRQVEDSKINDGAEMTKWDTRWTSEKDKDIECEQVLKYANNKAQPKLPKTDN